VLKFWESKIKLDSALPWAVAVLILIELVLRLPGFGQLSAVRETKSGEHVFEAASNRSPDPSIVALGSSRFQNSIIPEVVEERLNIGTGGVSNLSFDAATPQDYLHLYSTERSFFSGVDLLLVEVGEFQFNWSAIADEAAGNMRLRRLAGLDERLNTPSIENKIDYTLGYFVRIWDSRFIIRDMLSTTIRSGFNYSHRSLSIRSNGQIGLTNALSVSEFNPKDTNQLGAFGFRNFEISEYQLNAVARLLQIAEDDGVSVILMSPPLNAEFNDLVAQNYADYDQEWRNRVTEQTGRQIQLIEMTNPGCVNWQKCFYDFGHTNSIGANSFSAALAEYLSGIGY
jgi:hypothetical protein